MSYYDERLHHYMYICRSPSYSGVKIGISRTRQRVPEGEAFRVRGLDSDKNYRLWKPWILEKAFYLGHFQVRHGFVAEERVREAVRERHGLESARKTGPTELLPGVSARQAREIAAQILARWSPPE